MEFVKEKIEQLVKGLIENEPDLFLVEVKVKPTNNVKVYIDGDNGISIDKLVQYNRRLYRKLEELGIFPGGDFSLEVSSPGLDEPLKLHRQYVKNIGRFIEITDLDGVKREGKLLEVNDTGILIEEQKARPTGSSGRGQEKKREVQQVLIPIEKVKTTKIQIKI